MNSQSPPPLIKTQGTITLIVGPMFSGKTTELTRRMRIYKQKGVCVTVKFKGDNRYSDDNKIIAHSGDFINCIVMGSLVDQETNPIWNAVDFIGIDEGQFFEGLFDFCKTMTLRGKKIIISALLTNNKKEVFPNISSIIGECENIVSLKAICKKCKKSAHFTKKLTTHGTKSLDFGFEPDIGGTDKYIPVCRTCFDIEETLESCE